MNNVFHIESYSQGHSLGLNYVEQGHQHLRYGKYFDNSPSTDRIPKSTNIPRTKFNLGFGLEHEG